MQNIAEQEAYKELHRRQQAAANTLEGIKEILWMVTDTSKEEQSEAAYKYIMGRIGSALKTLKGK